MHLEANNIYFRYTSKTPFILKKVSFSIGEGERVGVVSPSGYGKTTLVKILAGYEKPTKGEVLLDGKPLDPKGILPVQLIPQHPESSVNPRWKMQKVLEEAGQLRSEVMSAMGIEPEWLDRYPRELSGGELQRFCVARALCADTRFLIADEISTMLDVITQAQIWRYILSEADRRGIGLVVVTHNPALAERVCARIVDLRDINHIEQEPK
ncbi:MAG: ATP-binding cassette domain-containing protein [Clostridiales bacterium]|jgi:peptide/nickel transport system ATP-binding protein|nr:ATP-binding cassette domain-containing protein [Clostridiales bacterium]